MPLNATLLAADMRAALLANPDTAAQDNDATTALCDVLAAAIVEHIAANAVVVPTALVAPPGGGPVTGVGNVT